MIQVFKKVFTENQYTWVDITDIVFWEGLSINSTINSSTFCTFDIKKSALQLDIGDCIKVIYKNNTKSITLFEGIVIYMGAVVISKKLLQQSVKAQDYTLLADRKIVNGSYVNKTAKQLIEILLPKTEDIKKGNVVLLRSGEIGDGILIEKANFNFIPFSEALNNICDLGGYYWRIDYDKKLSVWEDMAIVSPITLTQEFLREIEIEYTTESYRNVQITVGQDVEITSYRVDMFKGDGTQKTFGLSRGVANLKGITYEASVWVARNQSTPPAPPNPNEPPPFPWQEEKAVPDGTKDLTGAKWLFKARDTMIRQIDEEEPLGPNDYLAVIYTFYEPRSVILQLSEEVEKFKKKEETSGKWEKVEMAPELEKNEDLTKLTQSLLTRYGRVPKSIEVKIDSIHCPTILEEPFTIGEMIYLHLPSLNINQYCRINSLNMNFVGNLAQVNLKLLGSDVEQWWQYFAKQRKRDIRTIGAGETVLEFTHFSYKTKTILEYDYFLQDKGIGTAGIGRDGITC